MTAHEAECLANAHHFVAVRGRTPRDRTRQECASMADAEAFATRFGDGRTMIYAVTTAGRSAHIKNA